MAKEQMEKDYMYYACLMCKCGDADGKGIKQGRSYQEIDEGSEHYEQKIGHEEGENGGGNAG